MAASRALLEAFKFLRLLEVTRGVDLVCKHWHATAMKGELWAFLLEQELLVNRLSPMCQQDYPTLAASYISSRSSFIEFWRGSKQPEFLITSSCPIKFLSLPKLKPTVTTLCFEEGFRAVCTGRGTIIVTGYRTNGHEYAVVEYDAKSSQVTPLPCCQVLRTYHAIAADRDNVYLTGGQIKEQAIKSAEVFSSNEWRALPNMNFPAANHTMVLINSRLFTFGGRHDKAELFDSGEWRNLDIFLPWALTDFGIAVVSFKQVLLIGGEAIFGFAHFVFSLDLITGEIVRLAKTPPFRCVQNAVCTSGQEVTAVDSDGAVLTFKCPLQFRVTVKCVYEGVLLKANLKVKPSDTVGSVIAKFQEIVSKTRLLHLLMLVNGVFVDDSLSIIAADVTDTSTVDLVESPE